MVCYNSKEIKKREREYMNQNSGIEGFLSESEKKAWRQKYFAEWRARRKAQHPARKMRLEVDYKNMNLN